MKAEISETQYERMHERIFNALAEYDHDHLSPLDLKIMADLVIESAYVKKKKKVTS